MGLLDLLSAALSGTYEIDREIGRGGMSVVFLARDIKHDRDVAVKALRPEFTASLGAERFHREIQIVSHLEHIHLLPLFDSGTADGVLYFVMPYVSGGSLRDRLNHEGPLALEEVIRIAREVADGLAHANKLGIVHRDIKPENVLFVDDHAVVADFGIAHAYRSAGGETVTEQGVAIGTPDYMSPEQAAGEVNIDHRSDVYSLGCVVYEMLSGGPPFEGPTTQAVLAKHMHERVPSLAVVRPGLPDATVRAIEKALAKVPADRFRSICDFAEALSVPSPHRATRRLRVWRFVAVAAVPLLVLGAVVLWRVDRLAETRGDTSLVVLSRGDQANPVPDSVAALDELRERFASALGWIPAIRVADASQLLGSVAGTDMRSERALADRAAGIGADYVVIVEPLPRNSLTVDVLAVPSGDRVHRSVGAVGNDGLARAVDRRAVETVLELARLGAVDIPDATLPQLMTDSPRALGDLIRGQRFFADEQIPLAIAAFQRSVDADSGFGLSYYRLAMSYYMANDYARALEVVEKGLAVNAQSMRWRQLLLAQRHLLRRNGDSAIIAYQRMVLDESDARLPDAWLGLGESLFHLGAYLGHGLTDGLSAYDQLQQVDSTFAPMFHRRAALALWRGDVSRARGLVGQMSADHRERGLWTVALDLVSGDATGQGGTLRAVQRLDRRSLSILFAFLSRRQDWMSLADTVAVALTGADRTPDDRVRGVQYRFVILAAQDRLVEARRIRLGVIRGSPFDRWVVQAHLAGYDVADIAEPMLAEAQRVLRERSGLDFTQPPDNLQQQMFRAAVHRAVLAGDSSEVRALLAMLDAASTLESDPLPSSLRSAMEARLWLLAADTAMAIEHLRSAVSRPSPWAVFFPLAAMSQERLLLAELLAGQRRVPDARKWLDSFANSPALGDLLYRAQMSELEVQLFGRVRDSVGTRRKNPRAAPTTP